MKTLLTLFLCCVCSGQVIVRTTCGPGGPVGSFTPVSGGEPVNEQTGVTYTFLNADCGKLVTFSNVGAIAVTLPQANATTFRAGWYLDIQNIGAGTATITPTTSTVDGAATLALTTNQGTRIVSDGTNYFTQRGGAGVASSSVPTGLITLTLTSCPSGWSEVAALNGYTVIGTLAANMDVGTTGGSDSITPSGTNSVPTFTGNSDTSSAVSAGTPAGTNGASATSGDCAAANIAEGAGSTTACKATAPNLTVTAQTFTGSALSTHTHSTTATGSVTASTFTGNSADNRSAFVKVIFCSKI